MENAPRHRLATDSALHAGAEVMLTGNPAHYLTQVLRLRVGDAVALFNRVDGQWRAVIARSEKRSLTLTVETHMRPPAPHGTGLTVCFAPIKGGRLETIIEKATELGADALQPVITQRTIVDKVNRERADAIAREAAEQCERLDWPVIREPMKFMNFLGDWPRDVPLIYGDETGHGIPISELLIREPLTKAQKNWGILAGPEGGFTAEELAALAHHPAARGVGLGPRILRADTAIITLSALTLAAWGDWNAPPRFTQP